MKVVEEALNGLILLEPSVFGDERGYFFESFRQSKLDELLGENLEFVQDNESFSNKGVLRGLHFQAPPFAQGKLVRVSAGAAMDVVVDIRKESSSFGKHYSTILSEENKRVLWVPPGFAHGFVSLKNGTRFLYKCTAYYDKESEGGLLWNDPGLGIDWKLDDLIISDKDQELPLLSNLKSPF